MKQLQYLNTSHKHIDVKTFLNRIEPNGNNVQALEK